MRSGAWSGYDRTYFEGFPQRTMLCLDTSDIQKQTTGKFNISYLISCLKCVVLPKIFLRENLRTQKLLNMESISLV